MEQKELTGYPSIDKPWLKYYKEEAVNSDLPEQSIYGYMRESNQDHPEDIALIYLGRKLTYREMLCQIDRCAQSLTSVKVNCKIVEPETFRELSYGQIGEICLSGATMMLGYYNNPEATADVIREHPDGTRWLHTGDLGQMNENGVLFITGRIKRILPTMGPNTQPTKMFPDRIEKVVMKHDAVDLCCVIGIPDPVRTYYPRAYVVLNQGYRESEQLTEEIRQLCRDSLPSYMIPEEIEYCDDLPRTERGKVDYRELEKRANGKE